MKSLCQPPLPRLSGLFHKVSMQQYNTSTCTSTLWIHCDKEVGNMLTTTCYLKCTTVCGPLVLTTDIVATLFKL